MGLLDGKTFEQEHGKEIWEKTNLYPKTIIYPKYLVRPNDMMVFEIDESNNCYRPQDVVIKNRPNASDYFTYENLTQHYHFFPINEEDIAIYKYFEYISFDFMSWQGRPDGHGGSKGGTFTEFLRYNNIRKKS